MDVNAILSVIAGILAVVASILPLIAYGKERKKLKDENTLRIPTNQAEPDQP
jgi:hypothetical protein